MTRAALPLLPACLLFACLLPACAGPGDGPDGDAGPVDPSSDAGPPPFDVELGTGRDIFRPLDNGDTLYLERGFQGLQHVLISVRAADLEEARYRVTFSLTRTRDDEVVSEPAVVRLPFEALRDGEGVQIVGYQLVVRAPDEAVGEEAVVRIEMEGDDDELSTDARTVDVDWAPDDWDPDA